MAGKRRAERPRGRVTRAGVTVLAVLTLAVVALALWVRSGASDEQASADGVRLETTGAPTTSRAPDGTVPPVVTPSETVAPPSSPSAPEPAADLPDLEEGVANRIEVGDLVDAGFDEAVEATDGRLIPTQASLVARWAARGLPGSPGSDTVVVVGSMRAAPEGAFVDLEQVATGDEVRLTTYEGTLTYTVRGIARRPVADQTGSEVMARVPGRLVLVGARYDASGDRLDEDVVVVARLSDVDPG